MSGHQLEKAERQLAEAREVITEAERIRADAEREWAGGQLPLGLMLLAIGSVFTAERLGYIRLQEVWRYWPLFFVALAASRVLMRAEGALRFSFAMLFMAAIFFMNNFHILGIQHSWPLFIVLAGLMTLWRAVFGPAGKRPQS
jgi:LiaF transmembrane domain